MSTPSLASETKTGTHGADAVNGTQIAVGSKAKPCMPGTFDAFANSELRRSMAWMSPTRYVPK
jgi:hypothetical protein